MTLPELQPEIWSVIFGFLQRQPPPPWVEARARDFHQDALATVCRVSPLFHELAYPLLYTSVCVNDLALFFEGVDGAPESLDTKITSKAARLGSVRHLRLPGLPVTCQSDFAAHDLLERGDWSTIAEDKHKRLFRLGFQAGHELNMLLDIGIRGDLHILLTNVETVVIGQKNECAWKHIWGDFGLDETEEAEDQLSLATSMLTEMIFNLKPRHVCLYQHYGPYALNSRILPTHMKDTIFTIHQGLADLNESNFFCGAEIRYIVDRGTNYSYDGPSLFGQFDRALQQFTCLSLDLIQTGAKKHEQLTNSEIAIFGFFDPPPIQRSKGATGEKGPHNHLACVARREVELENRKDWMREVRTFIPALWKGRIRFAPYSKAPCCVACGWGPGIA